MVNENLLQKGHSFQVISHFERRSPNFLRSVTVSPAAMIEPLSRTVQYRFSVMNMEKPAIPRLVLCRLN